MPADAPAVHGLSADFLADKPVFGAAADEFLLFVGHVPLVAHNAGFDIAFLNAELKRAGKPPIATERVIDTLVLAGRNDDGGGLTRRPMFALWRKFTAQQTWRFARCQAVGRGLWRAD